MNYQDDFLEIRSRLFSLAYKMTKSVVDAEDIVQETFLAVTSVKAGSVRDPAAYFARVVIHRCFKVLDQRKLTAYPGPDLPEPLQEDRPAEWSAGDLSYGILLMLQRLKPMERAVFILRESLEFDYGIIAKILSVKADHCRQLLHRAKDKLHQSAPVSRTSQDQLAELMAVFLAAVSSGDSSPLIARLREDVTIYADGGGKRLAALKPVVGPMAVLKFMMGIYNKGAEGVSFLIARVNGEAAVLLHDLTTGLPETVMFFNIEETRLATIYMVRNPDKLKGIAKKATAAN